MVTSDSKWFNAMDGDQAFSVPSRPPGTDLLSELLRFLDDLSELRRVLAPVGGCVASAIEERVVPNPRPLERPLRGLLQRWPNVIQTPIDVPADCDDKPRPTLPELPLEHRQPCFIRTLTNRW